MKKYEITVIDAHNNLKGYVSSIFNGNIVMLNKTKATQLDAETAHKAILLLADGKDLFRITETH